MPTPLPLTHTEPARPKGRRTRAHLLATAGTLFLRDGYAATSLTTIAREADAHPNQVTYYFGSKDALFVHAAFLLLLRDAERLEPIGHRQRTPAAFRTALARAALNLPALPLAAQAMTVARPRPELHDIARHHLAVLFHQAAGYLVAVLHRHDWTIDRAPETEARTFWSTVIGARLIADSGYGGTSDDIDLPGVLTVRS